MGCMLYIISFFLISFLPPVLLLRLFLFFFLNIHFYQKVSSFKISHPCIHSFIHSFIHSYSFCIIYFCHPSKAIQLLSFFFSLSFSFQPRIHWYALNCLFCFFVFFRRVKLLISKYIFLLIQKK